MFIALEGIDGSGKEMHAKLLNRWVKGKGYETFLTKEPTSGAIGRLLREYLKQGELDPRTEALLFAADRSEHVKEILEKLRTGRVVITERYFYSSMAYQGASGIGIDWITQLNHFAPVPDLVLLLDIDPEISLARLTSKYSLRQLRAKEHFERRDFLIKVRDLYLDLAKKHENFAVIDASPSVDDVQTAVRKRVGRLLSEAEAEEEPKRQKELREYF